MSSRIYRLWQPSNPQLRIFLPDFWMKIIESPNYGRGRLPKNCVKFEVDKRMSRHDVREYLEKIYGLPVRDVRIQVVQGEITWQAPIDIKNRKALWKEEDKKLAYVFLKKGVEFEFPNIFGVDEEMKELEKVKTEQQKDLTNSRFANRDRHEIGNWYGI
uniref:Large ribosomal subunit protein uL23m n=2 Tax=Ascaris TaxID=6251 RepID=A0A0M3I4W4_ASCLU